MSCSVLEGTVKFNNANLSTSLFLKKKIASCPQLCSSSAVTHSTLCILRSKSLIAEHFHSWLVKLVGKKNLQSLSGKAIAMAKPSKPLPMWLHAPVCPTSSSRLRHLKALPMPADL